MFKIWDIRNFRVPVSQYNAHPSQARINGLDVHPYSKDQFVTCAQDCKVRYHHYLGATNNTTSLANPSDLKTAVPIWKADYTAFGNGLATVVVPQLKVDPHGRI